MYLLSSVTFMPNGSEVLYPLAVSETEAGLMDYAQAGQDTPLKWGGYCGLTRSQRVQGVYGGAEFLYSISQPDYVMAKKSCIPAMDFDA